MLLLGRKRRRGGGAGYGSLSPEASAASSPAPFVHRPVPFAFCTLEGGGGGGCSVLLGCSFSEVRVTVTKRRKSQAKKEESPPLLSQENGKALLGISWANIEFTSCMFFINFPVRGGGKEESSPGIKVKLGPNEALQRKLYRVRRFLFLLRWCWEHKNRPDLKRPRSFRGINWISPAEEGTVGIIAIMNALRVFLINNRRPLAFSSLSYYSSHPARAAQ